ncbi:uncharacterized protein [Ptychodera flava]|uniref:uncharacterized protein n=1 Tax=Ptychodera flava TaxID=63121 RepID=UPI00396A33E1
MVTPNPWRYWLLVVFQLHLCSFTVGVFDYYNDYPFYDESCKGSALEERSLHFDGQSSSATVTEPVPDLTEFTVCWWMRSDAEDNTGTIVSYYVSPDASIQIENPSNLKLTVNGDQGLESGLESNYGLWHHMCVAWKNFEDLENQGVYEIYKDGKLRFEGTGMAINDTILGGGTLLIGKPNPELSGSAYEGELTQFNMWSSKLDESEIQALSEDSINRGCGDIVRWTSIEPSDLDSVSVSDSDLPATPSYPRFCQDQSVKNDYWVFDGGDSQVTYDRPIPELSEFTVCFWIRVTDPSGLNQQTILSYIVDGDEEGSIVLEDPSDLEMTIRNEKEKSSRLGVEDGDWHHVCVSWSSKNGQHKYYVDGQVKKRRNLATDKSIRGGGTLVLGQKQTNFDWGNDPFSALSADISGFNMWSEALHQDDIGGMFRDRCNRTCGDVIWTSYFDSERTQGVTVESFDESHELYCTKPDTCGHGVFNDELWVVDNSGGWSLSPLPQEVPDLDEFTICYWMSLDSDYANLTNTVFSYFVPGDTEGSIVIEDVNDLVVVINNQRSEPTGINLNNGTSHMLCITWDSSDGSFVIYDRKEELYRGTGLAVGETIQGGGSLIVGQKQSAPAGGFNKEDAFYGKMRYFNFYSSVLGKRALRRASRSCFPDCGDVVSWHELHYVDLINIKHNPFICGGSNDTWTTIPPTTVPTTPEPPTTAAPTTKTPTTVEPTTPIPPTTPKPTTKMPTTAQPTTPVPPTTPKPTTEAPTTVKPTTPIPPTTPKPTTKMPTTVQPTTPVPPTTPKPTTEAPTTVKPTTPTPPTTPKPTTRKLTTAQPTTLVPPTTPKPTTRKPTTLAPTTPVPPTTPKPTTKIPTTRKPTTPVPPTTPKPTTKIPTTLKPTTPVPPTTPKPTTNIPTTLKPTTPVPPTTPKPTTKIPTTLKPTTPVPPTTHKPTTKAPTTIQPTTKAPPTTAAPTTKAKTTVKPTTPPPPTTNAPTTHAPTTAKPTTAKPKTTAKPTEPPPPPTTVKPTQPPPPTCVPEKPINDCPCPDISRPSTDCRARISGCYTNIALDKKVEQSSGFWYTQTKAAVDGDSDPAFCHGSCSVSQLEFEPWFRIDLGKPRTVHFVSVTTADDCIDSKPLLGAEVRVGNFMDFKKNRLCGVVTEDVSMYPNIDMQCLHAPVTGRYVTVQIRCRESRLYVCELEVWTDDTDEELDVGVENGQRPCAPPAVPAQLPGNNGVPAIPGMFAQFQQYVFNMCCSPNKN